MGLVTPNALLACHHPWGGRANLGDVGQSEDEMDSWEL